MSSGRVTSYQLSEANRERIRREAAERREAQQRRLLRAAERDSLRAVIGIQRTRMIDRAAARAVRAYMETPDAETTAPAVPAAPSTVEDNGVWRNEHARQEVDDLLAMLPEADRRAAPVRDLVDLIRRADRDVQGLLEDLSAEVDHRHAVVAITGELATLQATLQSIVETDTAAGRSAAADLEREATDVSALLVAAAGQLEATGGVNRRAMEERIFDARTRVDDLAARHESLLWDANALEIFGKGFKAQGLEVLVARDRRSFLAWDPAENGGFTVTAHGGRFEATMVAAGPPPEFGGRATQPTEKGRKRLCGAAERTEVAMADYGLEASAETVVNDNQPLPEVVIEGGWYTERHSTTTVPKEMTMGKPQ